MLINNFIQVIIVGKFPAIYTDKRGITVLMQELVSSMGRSMAETAPRLSGQGRTEALADAAFPQWACCKACLQHSYCFGNIRGTQKRARTRFYDILTDAALNTNTNFRTF